jgi:hypothetical protein
MNNVKALFCTDRYFFVQPDVGTDALFSVPIAIGPFANTRKTRMVAEEGLEPPTRGL